MSTLTAADPQAPYAPGDRVRVPYQTQMGAARLWETRVLACERARPDARWQVTVTAPPLARPDHLDPHYDPTATPTYTVYASMVMPPEETP